MYFVYRRDEFEPDKAVLSEILKYGLEVQEIINVIELFVFQR